MMRLYLIFLLQIYGYSSKIDLELIFSSFLPTMTFSMPPGIIADTSMYV